MKTNPSPSCPPWIIGLLIVACQTAPAQECAAPVETPLGEVITGSAPCPVVFEAPVVYNAPVIHEAPVVYNGPVYYMNQAPELVPPAPVTTEPSGKLSTVVVIGGRGGAYGYGHYGDTGQTVIRFGSEGGWFGR